MKAERVIERAIGDIEIDANILHLDVAVVVHKNDRIRTFVMMSNSVLDIVIDNVLDIMTMAHIIRIVNGQFAHRHFVHRVKVKQSVFGTLNVRARIVQFGSTHHDIGYLDGGRHVMR